LRFKAHSRSIEVGSHLQVREFYSHLPNDISKEDSKSVGQYIVDQFGEAEGFQFSFKQKYTLSKKARGYAIIIRLRVEGFVPGYIQEGGG
jgi:hypothetical protein